MSGSPAEGSFERSREAFGQVQEWLAGREAAGLDHAAVEEELAARGREIQRLREVTAATYHQVWWPSIDTAKYDGDCLPVWDEHTATYLDPDTCEVLPTWARRSTPSATKTSRCTWPGSAPVRRPGCDRRITRCQPVHRLPHQVPD
jgi:hypothetical protein